MSNQGNPSAQIDAKITDLNDWRGATLARMRALIREAVQSNWPSMAVFRGIRDDAECVMTWLALADGSLTEAELAEWLRASGEPIGGYPPPR